METSYWLGRKRASVANAHAADSSEARLVHLDLAGRYSIKAAASVPSAAVIAAQDNHEAGAEGLALALPSAGAGDAAYYERLETGARWLAARTQDFGERQEHLGMADRYARLRLEASEDAGAATAAPAAPSLHS